jgi:2-polyprenyl-6-methoxyphenol hydroxylase-like FAD-dependent oxidoreductase
VHRKLSGNIGVDGSGKLVLRMQGGCMAIEDGYQLSLTLDEAVQAVQPGAPVDIEGALRKYQSVSDDAG